MNKDENYWKGYIAAIRWVKNTMWVAPFQVEALNKKIAEIKKKWNT